MLIETIRNYRKISDNMDKIIHVSGHKPAFLERKMNMDSASFDHKRKQGNFTPEELEELFTIIGVDELEDKVLGEMSLAAEKDAEYVSLEESGL